MTYNYKLALAAAYDEPHRFYNYVGKNSHGKEVVVLNLGRLKLKCIDGWIDKLVLHSEGGWRHSKDMESAFKLAGKIYENRDRINSEHAFWSEPELQTFEEKMKTPLDVPYQQKPVKIMEYILDVYVRK